MVIQKYQPVKVYRKKFGQCQICQKNIIRMKTFEHTINPFNKDNEGYIKNYNDVLSDVTKEADNWIPDFIHDKCKEKK